jgi:hypothetical protein
MVWHGNQIRLQVFLKSIHEALPLLLIGVDVVRGIPPPSGELVEVFGDTHTSLLEVKELVTHDLDESRWNVGLAELGLEGFPSHHLALGLHGTDILPPCARCASQEMGGIEHLLVCSNSRILELVLDGAELVVGVQGLGGFGECWRVGVLEVPKCVAGFLIIISTIIVVAGGGGLQGWLGVQLARLRGPQA